MSNFFYSKLAINNVKNNKKMTFPYIVSSIFITIVFYIMASLRNNNTLTSTATKQMLMYGMYVMAILIIIFLFYTYSFLIKKRIKELGLYAVLGMTKRHIMRVVFLETFIIYLITTIFGILFGIIFDKLAYLFLVKLAGGEVKLGFNISVTAITITSIFFGVVYFLILLSTLFKIYRLNVISLLKEDKVGEKEPKSRWLLSLIGLTLIGYGYYTALVIKTPIAALMNFFYAVVAVIIGTYLLFIAISIFVLKILKNNKNYYYKTKNFISVSSMLYRMKKNAVGLASICILSTMSLVTLGSTVSLYYGTEDFVKNNFPRDVQISAYRANYESANVIEKVTNDYLKETDNSKKNVLNYTFLTAVGIKEKDGIAIESADFNNASVASLIVISLDEYNKNNNLNEELDNNEILIKSSKGNVDTNTFKIQNDEYKIKKEILKIENIASAEQNITDTYYVVVKDKKELQSIANKIINTVPEESKNYYSSNILKTFYAFDLKNNAKDDVDKLIKDVENKLTELTKSDENSEIFDLQSKINGEKDVKNVYASLMFIGIFISLVFTVSQVMIMYYKQITEGYDDKDKFTIMQKVGLEKNEIKQSIKSQVLIVFFSPLIVALIHVTVAYPFIEKVLKIFQLSNTIIFLYAMLITALLFSIFYFIIYKLTSVVYYNIISK
ncbi:ABC transporter permease [Gemelliphila palaticanis]|uniref:ABC transporter permease n=1 Tax=Gemelliphila palaticanis TaxID=81950 RepID=A0ABX2T302_9BACL|nr:FtsX-like permease family protein [Gemella palaticanis]MBF0715899.1 ABC transporter permease [Gemella palaticanis]NYS47829.1 ABC transporter permease [Gemella palaticanis]